MGDSLYRVELERDYLETAITELFKKHVRHQARRYDPVGQHWIVSDWVGLGDFEEAARNCGLEIEVRKWGDGLKVTPLQSNKLADYYRVEGGNTSTRDVTVRVGDYGIWLCLTCHNKPRELCEHAAAAKRYWEEHQ